MTFQLNFCFYTILKCHLKRACVCLKSTCICIKEGNLQCLYYISHKISHKKYSHTNPYHIRSKAFCVSNKTITSLRLLHQCCVLYIGLTCCLTESFTFYEIILVWIY